MFFHRHYDHTRQDIQDSNYKQIVRPSHRHDSSTIIAITGISDHALECNLSFQGKQLSLQHFAQWFPGRCNKQLQG